MPGCNSWSWTLAPWTGQSAPASSLHRWMSGQCHRLAPRWHRVRPKKSQTCWWRSCRCWAVFQEGGGSLGTATKRVSAAISSARADGPTRWDALHRQREWLTCQRSCPAERSRWSRRRRDRSGRWDSSPRGLSSWSTPTNWEWRSAWCRREGRRWIECGLPESPGPSPVAVRWWERRYGWLPTTVGRPSQRVLWGERDG